MCCEGTKTNTRFIRIKTQTSGEHEKYLIFTRDT